MVIPGRWAMDSSWRAWWASWVKMLPLCLKKACIKATINYFNGHNPDSIFHDFCFKMYILKPMNIWQCYPANILCTRLVGSHLCNFVLVTPITYTEPYKMTFGGPLGDVLWLLLCLLGSYTVLNIKNVFRNTLVSYFSLISMIVQFFWMVKISVLY